MIKEKLKQWFFNVNHVKYRKYFEEWYSNLTQQQLDWYNKVF